MAILAHGLRNPFGEVGFLSLYFKLTVRHKSSRQAEYITSIFDIHYSIFDIRFFTVSFSIRPVAVQASGSTEPGTWNL